MEPFFNEKNRHFKRFTLKIVYGFKITGVFRCKPMQKQLIGSKNLLIESDSKSGFLMALAV